MDRTESRTASSSSTPFSEPAFFRRDLLLAFATVSPIKVKPVSGFPQLSFLTKSTSRIRYLNGLSNHQVAQKCSLANDFGNFAANGNGRNWT